MNTSIDNLSSGQQSASSNAKPLWAAVGVLGAAVLAMGGTMLYQQRTPTPPPAAQVALVTPQSKAPGASNGVADDLIEKPVAAPAKPAPVPAKKVVKPTPVPAPARAPSYSGPAPAPATARVAQVCTVCGAVESVTPVERSTKPAGVGVGTVAGGVAGAVLGNQVGQGNGRTVATILGAIGGGFAGNAIEKNVRKEIVYQVGVRMEDGSRRSFEVAQAPAVGSKVTVEGSSLRSNEGAVYRAPAPVVQNTTQPAPTYSNQGQ